MIQRTRRGFIKVQEVLEKLGKGRSGAIQVSTEARIGSEEYRQAQRVADEIDLLAERLTGDREHFWDRIRPPDLPDK